MTKRWKFDALSDPEDLQSLFDSMAGMPGDKPRLEVIDASSSDGSDTNDLQALFDSVAKSFDDVGAAPASPSDAPHHRATDALAAPSPGGTHDDVLFRQLGQMARQVHDALRALVRDSTFQHVGEAVGDAPERLGRIAQAPEQVARRVRHATDTAMLLQARASLGADGLRTRWDKAFANQLSVKQFKQLVNETHEFLATVTADSRAANEQMSEIMKAQDVHELTGQMVTRVVELAQTLETRLLELLIESAPEGTPPVRSGGDSSKGLSSGSAGPREMESRQAQVDALLKRLGF